METSNVTIVRAAASDLARLQAIGRQTFTETFAATNTPENMARYLNEGFSAEKMAAELADADSRFYLALDKEEVVGYLKINTGSAQTELQDAAGMEIERIYVAAAYHGKKVAQLLYSRAIAVARELQAPYVWLGVWEKNPRAIAFYTKNGFVAFDKHIFRLGDDEQTDIMMRLELNDETPG